MTTLLRKLCLRCKRFKANDAGTASVEGVLWVPIFFLIFGLMFDASMIFNGQSHVLRVVQDANRHMSIGRFENDTEVKTYITERLTPHNITPKSIDITYDNAAVITLVTVPARQFQMIGLFSSLLDLEINVTHAHILESITSTELSGFGTVTSTY